MRRKVFYQAAGQRHYYFMNVGNGEVIDACRMVSCGVVQHCCRGLERLAAGGTVDMRICLVCCLECRGPTPKHN